LEAAKIVCERIVETVWTLAIFVGIWLYFKGRGGYRVVPISAVSSTGSQTNP
jgi:hypothetical protein